MTGEFPLSWYGIKGKYALRVKAIVEELQKTPYTTHQQLSLKTGIPKSTVTRILNRLERIGAIERSMIRLSTMNLNAGYRY
ncbi:MAG: winged helix-turn-helix domain-containing protein, partial [Candidatus Methanospirareceae archaeon]